MALTIPDLAPDVERRLKTAAARFGLTEADYAKRLIERGLAGDGDPSHFVDRATLGLLAQWDAEDAAIDPAEVARAQEEWEKFRKSMNEDSISGRPVYPEP